MAIARTFPGPGGFGVNMTDPELFDLSGIIDFNFSSSVITLFYGDGDSTTFRGFGFTTNGITATGGTVTSIDARESFTLIARVTGLVTSAVTISNFFEANNGLGLLSLLLRGNDTFFGSSAAEV